MNGKRFVLSFYKNAAKNFHITRISEPKEALQLHSHGYFQIYYLISGGLIHHLGKSTACLTAGDIFILPPNQPHFIEKAEPEVDFYSLLTASQSLQVSPILLQKQNQYLVSSSRYPAGAFSSCI